jgi:hypothetical protein
MLKLLKIIRMMTMTKRLYLSTLLCFLTIAVYSQEKDFGIWYGISAQHKLNNKLDIELSANVRTYNNAAKIEEAFVEGGLAYDLSKHFSVGGFYRFTESIENNNSYYIRHKFFLDLKGAFPVGNFSFTGRLRIQSRIKNYIEDGADDRPEYAGRLKFKALYKTPSFPVNPYLYVESFCPVFSDKTRTIEKNRFGAGLNFNIAKRHSIDIEYIFQRDYLPHISDISLISINYNIKF